MASDMAWNNEQQMPRKDDDDDDSWEVRAFEEDLTTGNALGCTWPPRSYSCTFCRREFRSAQALGGHMNVHRRDRAKLHGPPPPQPPLVRNAGVCFLYPLPNPSSILFPAAAASPPIQYYTSFPLLSNKPANPSSASNGIHENYALANYQEKIEEEEEVDLELRLGRR